VMTHLLAETGRFLSSYGLEVLWMPCVLLPAFALAAGLLRQHSAHVRGRLWRLFLLLMPLLPLIAQLAGEAGMPQRAVSPVSVANEERAEQAAMRPVPLPAPDTVLPSPLAAPGRMPHHEAPPVRSAEPMFV